MTSRQPANNLHNRPLSIFIPRETMKHAWRFHKRVIKEYAREREIFEKFHPKRRSFGQLERNKFYARNLEFRKDATRFELDSASRVVNRETVKNWKTCWYTVRTELLFQYLKVSTRNKLATLVKGSRISETWFLTVV